MVKRILQVVGRMDRGGSESLIMELFRNIDRNEFMFDFVVHTNDHCAYDEEIRRLGGRIYHVPRFTGTNIVSYRKAWKSFFEEHNEYKIVHGHIGSSAALYLRIAKKYGCYTIAHSHNTMSNNDKSIKAIMYRLFSYPTRYIADYFFACSKKAGIDRFGKRVCNASNFSVLHNGIDTEKFRFDVSVREMLRKELNIDDKFVVGVVGRITIQKNPFFIIEIFNELKKQNDKAYLIWCGDGELYEEVVKKVNELYLQNDVKFLGAISNVNEYMQAFDVFLFPSLWEGLGISLIEAQAVSLPCYVSDKIVDDAIISPLVKIINLNESASEWAKIIIKDKHEIRCDQSAIIIKQDYDIKQTLQQLINLFNSKS